MSLFQNTVALLYVISLVSCVNVSHTFGTLNEVTAVTEIVKDNNIYDCIIMSALLQRVNMDYIEGGQEKARVKKTTAEMAKAARLSPSKLINLLVLTFRNLFSTKPIQGKPPIKSDETAITLHKMFLNGLENSFFKEQLKPKESRP